MTRLFVTALLLLAPITASAARHMITGRVIDRNGEPVSRAIVSLDPGNVELVTDRDGRFIIDYLRANDGTRVKLARKTDYSVEIFKPGFHTTSEAFYFKKGAHTLSTFTLREETLSIRDDDAALDPELYDQSTQSSGATYEGD